MLLDPTTSMRGNYTTVISETFSESVFPTGTSPAPNKLSITSIVIPLCVLALCTIVGFAGICILLKLNLIQKQRRERSIANEVNHDQPCYEVIDPIYETIPSTESENLTQVNFGITMMRNEAYATHSQEKKCSHSLPLDFNVSRNEAYDTSENLMLKFNIEQQHHNLQPL